MARAMAVSVMTTTVALFMSSHASAQFLARDSLNAAEVQGILLQEVQGFFGLDSARNHVGEIENLLRPLFASLPKNAHGALGQASVRYALHRYFAQQHAWHIKGLEPTGSAWNETDPTTVLKGQVPFYVQSLFEDRLGEEGFGLHELAVFAAVLEHIVKTETVARVEASYAAMSLSTDESLPQDTLHSVLDTHEMIYLLALPFNNVDNIRKVSSKIDKVYRGWADTQTFLRDTRGSLAYAERDTSNPFVTKSFGFQEVVHVAEAVNDQFGHFQDIECRETKSMLLEREYKGTGRMLLADFYGLTLAGDNRFRESVDYLRQLGALDESDPADLRVIVSNYMYGLNNCFDSSSYYSVCCLDECNPLLQHLERVFAAPEAELAEVAAEVAQLSSSTVVAPRNLSSSLLRKLDDIARRHDGKIPLHGRLFKQFLHHAFPRECPHPHVSGTTSPKTHRSSMSASKAELEHHGVMASAEPASALTQHDLDVVSAGLEDADSDLLPWSNEEELLAERVSDVGRAAGHTSSWLRLVVMFGVLGSVVYGIVQRVQVAMSAVDGLHEAKIWKYV